MQNVTGRLVLILLAGAGLIVAPFLPGVSASAVLANFDRSLVDLTGGEALLLTGLGAIVVAVGWGEMTSGTPRRLGYVLIGIMAGLYAGSLYMQLSERVEDFGTDLGFASVGIGIYIALAASIVTLAGGLSAPRRVTAEPPR